MQFLYPPRIYIERDGQIFGPYDRAQLTYYIQTNHIMLHDSARIENHPGSMTVTQAMNICQWPIPSGKNAFESFRNISNFILPFSDITSAKWMQEKRFLLLAIIGIMPLAILSAPFLVSIIPLIYIAIAVYFSILWGLFFYFIFKTEQTAIKDCCLCFLITAFVSTTALLIIHAFGFLEIADLMSASEYFPIRFIGMFLVAGLPEEICKAAIIFFIIQKKGVIYLPQTIVLYGLFSGLGFGINEGVMYQLSINREFGIDEAYILNILRLTSLPFLHAVWCGISSFFIALSALLPMHRHGLRIIAILLPAIIHALYNSFESGLQILAAALGVMLFALYMINAKAISNKLNY